MDLGIKGRNALVTGASMGIGEAVARELAANGVNVAIAARDANLLAEVARTIESASGVRTAAIAADLGDAAAIERAVAEAQDKLGPIDILVNNAGSTPAGGLADLPDEAWFGGFNLKLMGYARCARALLPAMCERGWGRIVNIGGVGAYMASPHYVAGGAINAAVLALTKSLARTAAPSGVTVNGINPGPIATARWRRLAEQRAQTNGTDAEEEMARSVAGVPMKRAGRPEEVAAPAAFLCSGRAGFISGSLVEIDGAMNTGL